ncbi:MAG: hypothetical protein FJY10_02340 [Bacteroidetes bacterium]|nr:hypothetical protein [Bacteroidota bacterium]
MNSQASIPSYSEHPIRHQLITTIKDLCRVCFTCVRECPVKAITRILREKHGQYLHPILFHQGDGKGTCLGLPLIYGIVKMHKGQIHLKSNDDQVYGPTGTTFTITLPRKP